MDKKNVRMTTVVGFVVKGRQELDTATILEAVQSDEAEYNAVHFAIQQLKDKLTEFTIFCDHDSVVSIINRNSEKAARKDPFCQRYSAKRRRIQGSSLRA